jgi:hypothetical protein
MTTCAYCNTRNPGTARFCMECGRPLPYPVDAPAAERPSGTGFGAFGLSILGSLLLSAVLMFVFRLPVFLLFGFLPLLWWRRKE